MYCFGKGSKSYKNLASKFSLQNIHASQNVNNIFVRYSLLLDGSYSNKINDTSCLSISDIDVELDVPLRYSRIDYIDLLLSEKYEIFHQVINLEIKVDVGNQLKTCKSYNMHLLNDSILSVYCGFNDIVNKIIIHYPLNENNQPLTICELLIFPENIAFDNPIYHSLSNETYGGNDGNFSTYDLLLMMTDNPSIQYGKICVNLEYIYYIFTVTPYSDNPGEKIINKYIFFNIKLINLCFP